MGITNWLRGSSSKTPSQKLRRTIEKAKSHGGDPFREYRVSKILPESFEYGMNCFLDRIFEQEGEEVTQKTYEELRNMGGCTLIEDTSSYDIGGIPILVSVNNLHVGLDAYNNAVRTIKRGKEQKDIAKIRQSLLTDNPIFLAKLDDETEYDFAYKLATLSMGFKRKSLDLLERGKASEAKIMDTYSKVLQEMVSRHLKKLNDDDIDIILFTVELLVKIIPNTEVELYGFFPKIGTNFWNMLWNVVLEHFKNNFRLWPLDEKPLNALSLVDEWADFKIKNKGTSWLEHIRISGNQNLIWNEISVVVGHSPQKDLDLLTMVAIFLKASGRGGGISNALSNTDKKTLGFLFNKLALETMADSKKFDRKLK